jgi:hypothetical protein
LTDLFQRYSRRFDAAQIMRGKCNTRQLWTSKRYRIGDVAIQKIRGNRPDAIRNIGVVDEKHARPGGVAGWCGEKT